MATSGELFEQEFETWTPAQAKAFFRAGMVDDFFVTDIGGDLWVLTLIAVSREGRQMQIQLCTARELDPRKVRQFKTLDAAVRATGEIGFDVRTIGMARPSQRAVQRSGKAARGERLAVLADRIFEVASGRGLVAMGSKQKIHRIACLVHSTVQIPALTLDPDVGFVRPPALTDRAFAPPESFLKNWQ